MSCSDYFFPRSLTEENVRLNRFITDNNAIVKTLEIKSAQQKAVIKQLHSQLQEMRKCMEQMSLGASVAAASKSGGKNKSGLMERVLSEMDKLGDSVRDL